MADPVATACHNAVTLLPYVSLAALAISGLFLLVGLVLTVAGFVISRPKVPLLGIGIPMAGKMFHWGLLLLVIWMGSLLTAILLFATSFFAPAIANALAPGTAC